MDVQKVVIEQLIQAGGTLHGESQYTAAQTIWERALLLANEAGMTESEEVLKKMLSEIPLSLSSEGIIPVPVSEMKTFADIIGAKREKAEIVREFMRHHKYPNLYVQGKAMLMYGPPGTGKTMIAKGIVSAFNEPRIFPGAVQLYAASGADLKGKYFGETEKNIKSWFVAAQAMALKQNAVSILFLDEFESLAPNRQGPMASSAGVSSLTALLQFIDGVAAFDRVILLAATNGPWELDSAILRRFTSKLFVDLPSDETRQQLIAKIIGRRFKVDFSGANYDVFCAWASALMGASMGIEQYPDVDEFIRTDDRQVTRTGIHLLGYSLSDVTHAVDQALNMMAEEMIVQPQSNTDDGQKCYFELPPICSECVECTKTNGADLFLSLGYLSEHGGRIFKDAVERYPSSVNVDEYRRFVRYYKNPNQFDANTTKSKTVGSVVTKKRNVRRNSIESNGLRTYA
jgi:SpoVK/Ycf46/Vps4 family AAA+-type ATPase